MTQAGLIPPYFASDPELNNFLREVSEVINGIVTGGVGSALFQPNTLSNLADAINDANQQAIQPEPVTGCDANGIFGAIILSCDPFNALRTAFIEVYRATVNDYGQAVKIGNMFQPVTTDYIGSSLETYYYWFQPVSVTGHKGNLNAPFDEGISAKAALDPVYISDQLLALISGLHLDAPLRNRVDLIDLPTVGLVDRVIGAEGDIAANDAAVIQNAFDLSGEVGARIAGDVVNSDGIGLLAARVGITETDNATNASNIILVTNDLTTESTARTVADILNNDAIAALTTLQSADVATLGASITTEQTTRADGDALNAAAIQTLTLTASGDTATIWTWIVDEENARITADTAIVNDVNLLGITVNSNDIAQTAAQSIETTARIDADGLTVSSVTALTTTVSTNDTNQTAALLAETTSRISGDDVLTSSFSGLATQVDSNNTNQTSLVSSEQTSRIAQDLVLSSAITTLTATQVNDVATLSASLLSEQTARISQDDIFALDISALTVTVSNNDSDQAAAVLAEQTARITGDSVITANINGLAVTVSDNDASQSAAVLSEQTARITQDGIISGTVSVLTATVSSNDTAINLALTSEAQARITEDAAIVFTADALAVTVANNDASQSAAITAEQIVRITEIANLASTTNALAITVDGNDVAQSAGLAAEQSARIDADGLLTTSVESLTATVASGGSSQSAGLLAEQTARIDADGVLTLSFNGLASTVSNNDLAITAALGTEQSARISGDAATTSLITTLQATVNTNDLSQSAAVQSESTARILGDSASAANVSTIQVAVDGHTASLQQQATAIATTEGDITLLKVESFLKLDINGFISGVNFVNAGPGASGVVFLQDTFAIANPAIDGGDPKYIFILGEVDGVQSLVLDAQAVIPDASITNAKVFNLSANKIFAESGTIAQAIIGDGHLTNAMIGQTIKSFVTDFSRGIGWEINKNGSIRASEITIYGPDGTVLIDVGANLNLGSALDNAAQQWIEISGAGTPASYADVTANNVAAGFVNQGTLSTQNSVAYNSVTGSKPATDADKTGNNIAAGFVNQGIFSTAAKLSAATITAYLHNAAITNALIGHAAVDTLQLAGQAVTIPAGSYLEGLQYAPLNQAWTTVRTVTFLSSGAPTHISATTFAYLRGDTDEFSVSISADYRILRGGTVIYEALAVLAASTGTDDSTVIDRGTVTAAIQITPAAGVQTYSFQHRLRITQAGDGSPSLKTRNTSILVLELKDNG